MTVNGRFLTQPITGVQRYAHEVLASWQRTGKLADGTCELLTPPGDLSDAPLPARRVGARTGHLWEQLDLSRHVGGDVLFCPANTAPLVTLASRTPVVVTVHDLSYKYFPDAYTRGFRATYHTLIPLVMRRAAAVITVSETERQSIAEHFPWAADRIVAIPNGVSGIPSPGGAMARAADPITGRPYVLYVGSLSRRKNFEGFLRAFALLPPECAAVVVGSVPAVFSTSELRIPDTVADRIHFVGQLDDTTRLMDLYRGARCLVFPSFFESSGLPPLEAMANGCPVVVSDIPALRERCGDAALYCQPTDIESIAAQVRRLLEDPRLRDQLVRLGRERSAYFTWERCAAQTWDVLERAAAR